MENLRKRNERKAKKQRNPSESKADGEAEDINDDSDEDEDVEGLMDWPTGAGAVAAHLILLPLKAAL